MRAQSDGTPHLVVLAPESDQGRQIPLNKDRLVIGRGPACDIRFGDPCLSRAHAVLRQRGNAVYVEDLGSSAGTFVNGVTAVPARELHPGDLLTLAGAPIVDIVETPEPLEFGAARGVIRIGR